MAARSGSGSAVYDTRFGIHSGRCQVTATLTGAGTHKARGTCSLPREERRPPPPPPPPYFAPHPFYSFPLSPFPPGLSPFFSSLCTLRFFSSWRPLHHSFSCWYAWRAICISFDGSSRSQIRNLARGCIPSPTQPRVADSRDRGSCIDPSLRQAVLFLLFSADFHKVRGSGTNGGVDSVAGLNGDLYAARDQAGSFAGAPAEV